MFSCKILIPVLSNIIVNPACAIHPIDIRLVFSLGTYKVFCRVIVSGGKVESSMVISDS